MTRSKPLILNIDDDEAGRYAVNRVLQRAGFSVVGVTTGAAGLEQARTHKPDLVLLDVRLPDIDGFEVCRLMRLDRHTQSLPVVHMSASYLDVSSRVKGLENGADAYLTEPVDPAVLVATIRSLLRLKSAENQVRQAASEWHSTFEAIGDGVALLDTRGTVTRANSAFRAMDGLAPLIEAVFKDFTGVRLTREGEVQDRWYAVTMHPVNSEPSETAGAVCVVVDITEKKRFDNQLRQTARLESIGVLAGGIAHDFNNLLTGILGNATLLLEIVPPGTQDTQLLEEIVKASESAADLTRQLLAYSGKGNFMMAPVDLSRIAFGSRAFVRRFIPPRVELVFDTAPDLPLVQADAAQMQQVLMNLIINAGESFAPTARGIVRVTTGTQELDTDFFLPGETVAPGQYVALEVTDTGSGMDEATKSRIFDPFFTTKFTGRGLGLSAVHGILKSHKGLLRLNTKVGQGTTFRLFFPALAAASDAGEATEASTPELKPAARGRGTVLVVDDETTVRVFAKNALELLGYAVLVADNGQTALDIFRERYREISLVVLDLTMPMIDGCETLTGIRRIAPDARVLLSSGFSQAIAFQQFKHEEASGFLSKPYTAAQLASAVEKALDTKPSAA